MPHLIVIYGPPFSGKSTLARALAGSLSEKTAIVSTDYLAGDAIPVHDPDALDELDMVTTQVRLLVANYLKNGYNVVLEGAFSHVLDGELQHREQEIDQIAALMRNLAPSPMLVRLVIEESVLRERATAANRENEIETAIRINSAYKARYGRWLQIDTGITPVDEAVETLRERLNTADFR
jgi:adenylate kinase family enzyme